MNQNEIALYLQRQLIKDENKYFCVEELRLIFDNCHVNNLKIKVIKLYAWGFLEREIRGLRLYYRLNPKFINYNFGEEPKSIFDKDITMKEIRDRG